MTDFGDGFFLALRAVMIVAWLALIIHCYRRCRQASPSARQRYRIPLLIGPCLAFNEFDRIVCSFDLPPEQTSSVWLPVFVALIAWQVYVWLTFYRSDDSSDKSDTVDDSGSTDE